MKLKEMLKAIGTVVLRIGMVVLFEGATLFFILTSSYLVRIGDPIPVPVITIGVFRVYPHDIWMLIGLNVAGCILWFLSCKWDAFRKRVCG